MNTPLRDAGYNLDRARADAIASLLLGLSVSGGGAVVGHAQAAAQCGLGNGQKATGTPIKLGAIVTKQPGTDFTGITGMAQAQFNCVNDNGGINGRPIQYYSSEGAAQYLARAGAKSMVAVGANVPGGDHDISGVGEVALANGIPNNGAFLENVPISDASAIAIKAAQAAGDGGGVVINFTRPEGLKILQAAEQQGLIDFVMWAWSTPGNDASVAAALDSSWNGKVGINAELNLVDSTGPKNTLYQQVTKQYAPSIPLGSLGLMGFVAADIITSTLLALPADQLTQPGVNAAIRYIKNLQTDILCSRGTSETCRCTCRITSIGGAAGSEDGPAGGLLSNSGAAG